MNSFKSRKKNTPSHSRVSIQNSKPVTSKSLFQVTQALQSGDISLAEKLLEPVLKMHPDLSDAYHLKGILQWKRQCFEDAKKFIRRAIELHPQNASYHSNLGLVYKSENNFQEAALCFQNALRITPLQAETHYNLALVLSQSAALAEVIKHCEMAFELQPHQDEYKALLAVHILRRAAENHTNGDLLQACMDLKKVIALAPDYAIAHYNLGNVFRDLCDFESAGKHYRQAITLAPSLSKAHAGLGRVLQELDDLEGAKQWMDSAIALDPHDTDALSLRGVLHKERGDFDAALQDFDQAIRLAPLNPEPNWNKALALLQCGRYSEGWPLYEWRWKHEKLNLKDRKFTEPLWLGQAPLNGKTILLHAEQGLGDTLQFCRYVPLVAKLGAKVILEIPPPLLSLLRKLEGVNTLIPKGSTLPHFDYHCPLLSLPLAFGTQLSNIPSSAAYLFSDAEKRKFWENFLGPKTAARIGLAWRGNAKHQNDKRRSMSLVDLFKILPLDAHYFSLQQELNVEDRAFLNQNPGIRHFGDRLLDFDDTAALCDAMDLVVTVDTSVAHLSGALGKPTWIILPRNPDWRWLHNRNDSPWYPAVQLIHKTKAHQDGS